jgi:hypothetical protein
MPNFLSISTNSPFFALVPISNVFQLSSVAQVSYLYEIYIKKYKAAEVSQTNWISQNLSLFIFIFWFYSYSVVSTLAV